MKKLSFGEISSSVGKGFLTGQGLSIAKAVAHSVSSAPKGSKLKDFKTQFFINSKEIGSSMAEWSLVHTVVSPFVNNYIKNTFLNEMVGGAITGALMEWRSGPKGMVAGTFKGTLQNAMFSGIGYMLESPPPLRIIFST